MRPADLAGHEAIPSAGGNHAASDFGRGGALDVARADIGVRTSTDGDRIPADRLAREPLGLNPIRAGFHLSAPNQRYKGEEQRKSHHILHLARRIARPLLGVESP